MTIKVDTGTGWAYEVENHLGVWELCYWAEPTKEKLLVDGALADDYRPKAVRLVRVSDWRKIMAVVREADLVVPCPPSLFEKVDALREHLKRRK